MPLGLSLCVAGGTEAANTEANIEAGGNGNQVQESDTQTATKKRRPNADRSSVKLAKERAASQALTLIEVDGLSKEELTAYASAIRKKDQSAKPMRGTKPQMAAALGQYLQGQPGGKWSP